MSFFNICRANGGRSVFARSIALLIMLLAGLGCCYAQLPEELNDPNAGNPDNFIADPYGQLSPHTKEHINEVLKDLRDRTTAEVGVAVIRTTGDLSTEDYAYRLFNHWQIGKADNNNGVLLLVAIDDRKARIEVGSGVEGAIPDISAMRIIRERIMPAMQEGSVSQAVSTAVDKIYDVISDPDVAAELRSDQDNSAIRSVHAIDRDILVSFIAILAGCVFLFTLVMFLLDYFNSRKRGNYQKALTWRPHIPTYWWGAVFSCGLALPIAILAWWLYRHARDKVEICDTCGAKMQKLSEDKDNAFLSASQDFEEQLGTVDYDVWLCPECGTVERFPYVERQLKYSKCPECNTIAMNLVMDKVVDEPTTKREGHGERIYQCQFCRHRRREGYRIPKKADPAAAALAAGAVAGMLRGNNSGGGFGGGGFGGGHSSGGGATGGW